MVKLRFAVRKFDPFERHLQACWEAYRLSVDTAVEMEFIPMDLPELYSSLFENKGLQTGEWDLVHLNTDWLAEAYQQGGIYALDRLLDESRRKAEKQRGRQA